MAELILKVPTSDANKVTELTRDDTVSRQSITTREASAIGLDGDVLYVRITGGDDGVAHAKKLAAEQGVGEPVEGEDAAKVSNAIQEQEDTAAEGMGLIDF